MSRALRLHEHHTRAELVEKLEAVKADPCSFTEGGLHLFTPQARRLMDDLLLAIYWHDASGGNTNMNRAAPAVKNW